MWPRSSRGAGCSGRGLRRAASRGRAADRDRPIPVPAAALSWAVGTGWRTAGAQRLLWISARTIRHVVSDGGWMPMRSAVLRIVSLSAFDGW